MFRSFLVQILIQKHNTVDKILENKFYIIKQKKRKDIKDKLLQICSNLRDLFDRESSLKEVLLIFVVFMESLNF